MDTSRFLKALNRIMSDRYGVKIEYEVKPCGTNAMIRENVTQEMNLAAV